jgi:cytochrome c-type biogenesis protein CcsB
MTCASLLPKDITQQLMPALQSYWLWIHVSLAALGEGAFAVAFAVSLMYLVQQARSGGAEFATAAAAPGGAPQIRAASGLQAQVGTGAPQRGMAAGMVAVLDAEDPLPLGSFETNGGGNAEPRGQEAEVLPTLGLLDEINYRAVAIGYPLFTVGALFAGAIWAYKAWGTFWSWDPKEVGALIVWLFYTAYLHARLQRAWRGRRAAWLSVAGFAIVILSFLGNLWLGGNHAYN